MDDLEDIVALKLLEMGWTRHLPHLVFFDGCDRESPVRSIRDCLPMSWNAPLWDELPDKPSDDDWEYVRSEHPEADESFIEAEVARIHRDEVKQETQRRQEFHELCVRLNQKTPESPKQFWEFMVAIGLVTEFDRKGERWFHYNDHLNVLDVLPLSEEARIQEERDQRHMRYAHVEGRIIDLFGPEGVRRKSVATSIVRLSRWLGLSETETREAVLVACESGDITCSADVTTIKAKKAFVLEMDWAVSARERIRIRLG